MTTATVSRSLIPPQRSKDAFRALMEEWQGILGSDGDGVEQHWIHYRQTCLAHLMRSARGLSQKRDPERAACGPWARKELQALCHMAKALPTGGQWRAW
jgi:transposase